jgi:hypothetical protein
MNIDAHQIIVRGVRVVGQALGASHLIEGSVRKAGNRLVDLPEPPLPRKATFIRYATHVLQVPKNSRECS